MKFSNDYKHLLINLIDCAEMLGLPKFDLYHATEFMNNLEPELCFDTIVTQIYELDIEVNADFYLLIEKTAFKLNIPNKKYCFLKELIRDESNIPKPVKFQIGHIVNSLMTNLS